VGCAYIAAVRGAAIVAEQLTKRYGTVRGVESVDLEVGVGEVFGFLGPNGAGKTTFIRTLLDLIRPTSGRALVLGLDSHDDSLAIRRRVGYLPGDVDLWPKMTGAEVLDHLARLRGGVDRRRVDELYHRFAVDPTRRIEDLSKGNRQKLGVVQAFMHDPELLILDEPTSGLDPLQQQAFRELVHERSRAGTTVFLSSHVLSEVEHTAGRVGIIKQGRLIDVDEIAALKARAVRTVEVSLANTVDPATFASVPGVQSVRVLGPTIELTVTGPMDALVKALAQHEVVSLASHEPDLEELVLAFYEDSSDA
jgi:ABC-2 type transport system ATP-binding protein